MDPIRPVHRPPAGTPPIDPTRPADRAERRTREEREAEEREREQAERDRAARGEVAPPDDPPDDGRPHVDIRV